RFIILLIVQIEMKQKTKKLLQLSFSLGFLATTALVATSCNQPKTVTPKPTNPMQPRNGSGSETTTPGSGETMQPGNGSGTGTGTTTPDNSEAKNQLKALIDKENDNLGLYADYSVIKSKLVEAYAAAKEINNKANVTVQELTDAKTALENAVNKAKTDKTAFNAANSELVTAYGTLKSIVSEKDSKQQVNDANSAITSSVTELDKKKENVDEYSTFKSFVIDEANFKGNLKYSSKPANTQSLVGFSSDFDNSASGKQWRFAKRMVKNLIQSENNSKYTNVGWIYSLDSQENSEMQASYDITFKYYGGSNATLYFPYKASKSSDIQTDGTSENKLTLKYKLNDETFKNIEVSNAKVDSIEVAEINLNNLKFGDNTISFKTEMNKVAPMIGNIYISSTNMSKNAVYDDIFGNEKNDQNSNIITVNLAKGYGLANKGIDVTNGRNSTIITKLTGKLDVSDDSKDYILLGYLGNSASNNNASNVKYYTFYVNANKSGTYNISGIYNTGENRQLSFWTDMYNNDKDGTKAKFKTDKFGEWNDKKLKTFNSSNKIGENPTSLMLKEGLNKIIVSGGDWNTDAPNLGNITFSLNETSTSVPASESTNVEGTH
ncbi:Vmc-like lipoprotein signal peptide domain-containing protein, partial [Mycoplasma bradburyae]|uniref:Vmc-like lipoprotein signal peptide domain-containing protein n=1 Tax=Mycoplasma bradburyae TaxID=2963128 RepID=UPI002927D440|nr:hypothetical protein [Mycoplasma bradburyae]